MPRQRTARAGTDPGIDPGMVTSKGQTQKQTQGGSMMDEAKDKAQAIASQAQDKMTEQLDAGVRKGKNRAAGALGSVAQSLVFSSQQLREQDQHGMSRYAERAAQKVEQLAGYMQNTNVSEMTDRVESFARREPALFLGGAFALGLLGARFLKSSREAQMQRRADSEYPVTTTRTEEVTSRPGSMAAEREVPRARIPGDSNVTRTGVASPGMAGSTRAGAGGAGSPTEPTS